MMRKEKHIPRIVESIFTLHKKCTLKDYYLIKKVGISYAEYHCLTQFYDIDSISMKELSDRLEITPGGVTRIVTSLEKRKLIERRINNKDRRGIDVFLTKKGKRLVKEIYQTSLALHEEIIGQIKPKDRKAIITAIDQLTNAVTAWLDSQAGKE